MKNYENRNVYLYFALLNAFTVCFLLPFFASEVSWAKPGWLSYTVLIRLFFYAGAFTTIYFANSFIIAFLRKKEPTWCVITRLGLFVLPLFYAFRLCPTFFCLECLFFPIQMANSLSSDKTRLSSGIISSVTLFLLVPGEEGGFSCASDRLLSRHL